MPSRARTALLACLIVSPLFPGCSTLRTVGHVIDTVKLVNRGAARDDTVVSFTLQEGPELVALAEGLSQFDVQADIEAVEQGITIVRLVGAYVEVMNTIHWLIVQGSLAILGNDETSEALLAIVVSVLKSGG